MVDFDKVRIIEIEIHSYCNRKCPWCPNSTIDRTFYKELPEDWYGDLIENLRDVRYKGYISFSRYNEPLAFPALVKQRGWLAKHRLPGVKIICNSNGDYPYKDFRELYIDELTVMDYDKNKEVHCDKGNGIRVMRLGDIHNRAGYFTFGKTRTKPCFDATYFIGIDYNGNVMPCCNFRSDYPLHQDYIMGNISDRSIVDIYNSEKYSNFRKRVENCDFPEPCKVCIKRPSRYTKKNPKLCDDMDTWDYD